MQANLEREDEQILNTIDLTSKLQQSLRKLLTKKKSIESDHFAFTSPKHQKQELQLHEKIQILEQQNKELYSDNQQLSKELLSVKEELRQCKKQLTSTKKYLQFLQSYNDDLKKEMLFWMKNKKQPPTANETSTMGELMKKIIKLRKENEDNQKKLLTIKDTLQIKTENSFSQTPHQKSLNFDLTKFQNEFIKRKRSLEGKRNEENSCTSCNYKTKGKSKSKKSNVTSNFSTSNKQSNKQINNGMNKGKNLRKWHNHYVSNSEYAY